MTGRPKGKYEWCGGRTWHCAGKSPKSSKGTVDGQGRTNFWPGLRRGQTERPKKKAPACDAGAFEIGVGVSGP